MFRIKTKHKDTWFCCMNEKKDVKTVLFLSFFSKKGGCERFLLKKMREKFGVS